jgi:hypothetical protein
MDTLNLDPITLVRPTFDIHGSGFIYIERELFSHIIEFLWNDVADEPWDYKYLRQNYLFRFSCPK